MIRIAGLCEALEGKEDYYVLYQRSHLQFIKNKASLPIPVAMYILWLLASYFFLFFLLLQKWIFFFCEKFTNKDLYFTFFPFTWEMADMFFLNNQKITRVIELTNCRIRTQNPLAVHYIKDCKYKQFREEQMCLSSTFL
jgi:hypothetical protein